MITHEIEEFGRRMGMSGLELSKDGIIAFEVEDLGSLHIEQDEENEELFIYLATPVPPYNNDISKKVLELCNYKHAHPFILHGGIHKDNVIFLSRINYRDVKASTIENITQFLISITQKIL